MYLLEHQQPEDATGSVKQVYDMFPPGIPVPDPLVVFSASPGLLSLQGRFIAHFMQSERLDMGLQAMIRYVVAARQGHPFCEPFNAQLLQRAAGLDEDALEDAVHDLDAAPLEESQKAMLKLALKVVEQPEEVGEADVQLVRNHGYSDADILDASMMAASMIGSTRIYKAFRKP